MKIDKTHNATRNVTFGIIERVYNIIVPFAFRTIMIRTIGVEYLGLNSLFTSILQVLNLAELGVGSAMVFSMYKPIVEDDTKHINALMNLYKIYYRIIGLIILCIGLACTPFIPNLIHGSIPSDMNVYILYLMNLGVTVLTYWLYAYKNSILSAYQRKDIISKVNLATYSLKYILQVIALICFKSYYLYVLMRIITQIISNIITAIASHKLYPQYKASGVLSQEEKREINGRVRDLFTAKVGGVIIYSADTIVISSFLGLKVLAIYQNYYYIISAIMAFITIINTSVVAGVGNSLIIRSEEENYAEFKVFSFLQLWIVGFCICCFISLFQPFMTIWMGEKMLLDFPLVILMSIVFLGDRIIQSISVYKDAGGIWNKDRFRPLIAGMTNLVLNIIMVRFCGLYGVTISTIVSMFMISIPWIIFNVYKYLFAHQKIRDYVIEILIWFISIALASSLSHMVCSIVSISGITGLALKIGICLVIPNLIFYLLFRKKTEYFTVKRLIIKTIHR